MEATKLERALRCIKVSAQKDNESNAWIWAQDAANIAGVKLHAEANGNRPDLERLEKDVRVALCDELQKTLSSIEEAEKYIELWISFNVNGKDFVDRLHNQAFLSTRQIASVLYILEHICNSCYCDV